MPLQRRPQLMNDDRIAIEETALAVDVNARTRNDNNVMVPFLSRVYSYCSLHGQRAAAYYRMAYVIPNLF
jgi:hypothetical protein